MNIQDILKQYPYIGEERLRLNKDLRTAIEAKLNADGCIKASIISDSPRSGDVGNPTYRNTENLFEHLEEICVELANIAEYTKIKIRDLDDMQKQIDEALLSLTWAERRIIDLRYFQYPEPKFGWNKVIKESHYSRAECFRDHGQALEKMRKRIKLRLYETIKVV